MNLHKEIKRNNTPENFKAWLYKCALNKFINIKKRNYSIQLTDNIDQFEKSNKWTIETKIYQKRKNKKYDSFIKTNFKRANIT